MESNMKSCGNSLTKGAEFFDIYRMKCQYQKLPDNKFSVDALSVDLLTESDE